MEALISTWRLVSHQSHNLTIVNIQNADYVQWCFHGPGQISGHSAAVSEVNTNHSCHIYISHQTIASHLNCNWMYIIQLYVLMYCNWGRLPLCALARCSQWHYTGNRPGLVEILPVHHRNTIYCPFPLAGSHYCFVGNSSSDLQLLDCSPRYPQTYNLLLKTTTKKIPKNLAFLQLISTPN